MAEATPTEELIPASLRGLSKLERRRRALREQIHSLTGSVIDHKAAGRFASACVAEQLVAELRRELANLAAEHDTEGGAGGKGRPMSV